MLPKYHVSVSKFHISCVVILVGGLCAVPEVRAQVTTPAATATPAAPAKSKFETLIEGHKAVDGLLKLYTKDQQLLVDIPRSLEDHNFIILTSIARGISRGFVLGGLSWNLGEDDVLWTFKKAGDKLHVIRRNVRFRAKKGSPEMSAVQLAYSDSVLYALPILTTTPSGGSLVDMTRIFMSDDQQIGRFIGPGFYFASDRSTWAKVKGFEKNIELEVAAVYSGGGEIDTVADSRGVQVNVHYSISLLPNSDYTPRIADDRVGYFLTVLKDFSDKKDDEQFVRYINRWNLQRKAVDTDAKLVPPKKSIKFYLEKTVPVHLVPIVRSGILEWNKAFEKLGISDAIEVEEQKADFDPEDINYNTFRWITAEAGFAMGPSRVNPMTGEILDADIIFDASFLKFWKTTYETFTQADAAEILGQQFADRRSRRELPLGAAPAAAHAPGMPHLPGMACTCAVGMQNQMGFAGAVLQARGLTDVKGKVPDELIAQGLKEVVMHEVGHTLGLRHNFKASSWKPLTEIDDPMKGAAEGTVASIMDYTPTNIAPKGIKQGLYYPQTIGPYDYWAIEYGYKPLGGDESKELAKIAARGSEPGLDYATDEDTREYFDGDPLSNRWDLGNDPIEFAHRQMTLASELWPKVLENSVGEGEGYQRARQAFGMLFKQYWTNAFLASRFAGGVYVHRDHKGDVKGRPPFELVEAPKQRAAMKLLNEMAFSTFHFPPEVLNHLAATRWYHWGIRAYGRPDYPIHEYVGRMQSLILFQLLSPVTLGRLHDSELKVAPEADAYTLAEHMRTLVEGLFSEWKGSQPGEFTSRKPYILSFRRNLQRTALSELAYLVTVGDPDTPDDARTLARFHLSELDKQLTPLLANQAVKLDDYSKAHALDCQEQIRKVLQANLQLRSIN